jgi:hypothetical protein
MLMLVAASSGAICQLLCASRASMSGAMASPHAHCQEMPAGAVIAAPACTPANDVASPASIVSTTVRLDLAVAITPAWRPNGAWLASDDAGTRRMTSSISPPAIGDPPSVLRI